MQACFSVSLRNCYINRATGAFGRNYAINFVKMQLISKSCVQIHIHINQIRISTNPVRIQLKIISSGVLFGNNCSVLAAHFSPKGKHIVAALSVCHCTLSGK